MAIASPDGDPAGPSDEPGHSIRALFAAGAAAGLLPFVRPQAAANGSAVPIGYAGAIAAVATSAAAPAAETMKHVAAHGDDGRSPALPTGPPGNAGAAGIAGAPGGAASGVWCAILVCCLLHLGQELRRRRDRLSLPAPTGVALLLQRPG